QIPGIPNCCFHHLNARPGGWSNTCKVQSRLGAVYAISIRYLPSFHGASYQYWNAFSARLLCTCSYSFWCTNRNLVYCTAFPDIGSCRNILAFGIYSPCLSPGYLPSYLYQHIDTIYDAQHCQPCTANVAA